MNRHDPLRILRECEAVIRDGHFVYDSGRHGDTYVNKRAVFRRPEKLSAIALRLALACSRLDIEVVAGPAVGGAFLAQWVAGYLCNWGSPRREVLAVYAEKTADHGFAFNYGDDRRIAGKRVLIVEDVLTTGASARKVVDAARAAGATVVGVGALVNRGGVSAKDVGDPPAFTALVDLPLASWDETSCPLCAAGVPVNTELGKGAAFLARKRSQQPA